MILTVALEPSYCLNLGKMVQRYSTCTTTQVRSPTRGKEQTLQWVGGKVHRNTTHKKDETLNNET